MCAACWCRRGTIDAACFNAGYVSIVIVLVCVCVIIVWLFVCLFVCLCASVCACLSVDK